jgi:hypothetical protein
MDTKVIFIIGEQGSGKTTLAKEIMFSKIEHICVQVCSIKDLPHKGTADICFIDGISREDFEIIKLSMKNLDVTNFTKLIVTSNCISREEILEIPNIKLIELTKTKK